MFTIQNKHKTTYRTFVTGDLIDHHKDESRLFAIM